MCDWQAGDEVYVWDDEGPLPATIADPGMNGSTWRGWPTVIYQAGGSPTLVNPNMVTSLDGNPG